jgi:hypothetical protein
MNPFMASKNKKKIISKPETKNLTKIKYVFLGNPLCELPSSKETI